MQRRRECHSEAAQCPLEENFVLLGRSRELVPDAGERLHRPRESVFPIAEDKTMRSDAVLRWRDVMTA